MHQIRNLRPHFAQPHIADRSLTGIHFQTFAAKDEITLNAADLRPVVAVMQRAAVDFGRHFENSAAIIGKRKLTQITPEAEPYIV